MFAFEAWRYFEALNFAAIKMMHIAYFFTFRFSRIFFKFFEGPCCFDTNLFCFRGICPNEPENSPKNDFSTVFQRLVSFFFICVSSGETFGNASLFSCSALTIGNYFIFIFCQKASFYVMRNFLSHCFCVFVDKMIHRSIAHLAFY